MSRLPIKHFQFNDFNRTSSPVITRLTVEFSRVIGVWLLPTNHEQPYHSQRAVWTCLTMIANLTVCLLGWWKCFANNYLQWAAVFTWCFINVQGNAMTEYYIHIIYTSLIIERSNRRLHVFIEPSENHLYRLRVLITLMHIRTNSI